MSWSDPASAEHCSQLTLQPRRLEAISDHILEVVATEILSWIRCFFFLFLFSLMGTWHSNVKRYIKKGITLLVTRFSSTFSFLGYRPPCSSHQKLPAKLRWLSKLFMPLCLTDFIANENYLQICMGGSWLQCSSLPTCADLLLKPVGVLLMKGERLPMSGSTIWSSKEPFALSH